MTRDDIIRMAREAGFKDSKPHSQIIVRHSNGSWINVTGHLDRFARLVAAAAKADERGACADICDQHASIEGIAQRCASDIRARGNK